WPRTRKTTVQSVQSCYGRQRSSIREQIKAMSVKRNPIQRRLVNLILLISGAVLLLACTTILTYEFLTSRQTTVEQASTLGKIIATNSTAALAFDNPTDANEILSALKAERSVVGAGLYNKE